MCSTCSTAFTRSICDGPRTRRVVRQLSDREQPNKHRKGKLSSSEPARRSKSSDRHLHEIRNGGRTELEITKSHLAELSSIALLRVFHVARDSFSCDVPHACDPGSAALSDSESI